MLVNVKMQTKLVFLNWNPGTKSYSEGTQKNPLHEMGVLNTENKCWNCLIEQIHKFTPKMRLFRPMQTFHNLVETMLWSKGYKTFSCWTQLSIKIQLLIKTKMPTTKERFLLKAA